MNEVEELKNKLQEVKDEYQDFAYIVSHDFSAPFRQIEGFLKIIENKNRDNFDERSKELFEMVIGATEKCQSQIKSLLSFSRAQINKNVFEEFDCNELIDEVREEFKNKNLYPNCQIKTSNLPKITSDKHQVYRVFYSIIDNGLKFQTEDNKPLIEINSEQKDDFTEFTFKDNGIGIKKGFQDKIFTIFRKGFAEEEYAGEGIGLAISKKLLDQLGGKIWLEQSEEDIGSVFKVSVPQL